MIDNSKEYIVCAAYKVIKNFDNVDKMTENGKDPRKLYASPHNQVFDMALGFRHPDILWKHKGMIGLDDSGGFMTSTGRYVDRNEAMKIACECGQVPKDRGIRNAEEGTYWPLYSEDIY